MSCEKKIAQAHVPCACEAFMGLASCDRNFATLQYNICISVFFPKTLGSFYVGVAFWIVLHLNLTSFCWILNTWENVRSTGTELGMAVLYLRNSFSKIGNVFNSWISYFFGYWYENAQVKMLGLKKITATFLWMVAISASVYLAP